MSTVTTASPSRPFIFPGSARSQIMFGADGNNNNNNYNNITNGRDRTSSFSGGGVEYNNNNNNNEFFFDASPTGSALTPTSSSSNNKRGGAGTTPIENPLLFRSTPSSSDNRNNPYYTSTTPPLGSVPVNVIGNTNFGGGNNLRQRKGFVLDNNNRTTTTTTSTQQQAGSSTSTDSGSSSYPRQRVLPPRASYTLQTENVNYQQQHQSNRFHDSRAVTGVSTTTASSASTPIFGTTNTNTSYNGIAIDQIPIDNNNRTTNPSVFTFNNNNNSAVKTSSTLQVSTADIVSPRTDNTANMYSPSQVSLNNITTSAQSNNRSTAVTATTTTTSTTWVLVFGATITQTIYEDLVYKLSEFGKIIGQRGRSNWLAVQYEKEFEVEKAVCHYRIKVRTNTDLVFYTIQRLTLSDPDMRIVLQQPTVSYHNTTTTNNNTSYDTKPKSIWSTTGNNNDGLLFLTSDNAAATTTADDVASVDTVVISNKRLSSINNNTSDSLLLLPSSTDLTENDILDGPLLKGPNGVPSNNTTTTITTPYRPRTDSFCVKLLKLLLQIEEDE